jgi:glycosyltransferase involved in cell wall biosynthesis
MIVRNESATIARCLRAAKPLIDSWSIVDTGSTDDTKEIIARELEGVPGRIWERPWTNFGANREESFELARAVCVAGAANTWCLLLDADHEIEIGRFNRASLTAAGYCIRQRDGGLDYDNVRLIRADTAWKCVGVTHEYWAAPDVEAARIEGLTILDHCDGGTRSEKYPRDEALLRAGLIAEPGNARYMFYLAQTLQDQGKTAEAIEWYAKRAEAGGFAEEAWMARLRMGRLQLGNHDTIATGIATLIAAYNDRPQRAEALYSLANHYRIAGKNAAALMVANTARRISKPDSERLFVERGVYDTGIDEEISIAAWYTNRKADGLAACERLLARHGGHAEAERNVSHYAEPIPTVARGTFSVPEAARTFNGTVYSCSNPSVCRNIANVRLVNYDQQRGQWYVSRDPDGRIRTKNWIVGPDGNGRVLDDSILTLLHWPTDVSIHGLEDLRLFALRDRVWFSATCCQVPGANGQPQVVLGRLSEDLSRVDHLVPIQYIDAKAVEKNWILWPQRDGSLRCVYSFSPLVILDVAPETGAAALRSSRLLPTYAGRFRGSAHLGGNVFLVHDVARFETGNVYAHRFLTLHSDNAVHFSAPFVFDHRGIEYACGARLSEDGYGAWITYGHEDREARWVDVDLSADGVPGCTNSF